MWRISPPHPRESLQKGFVEDSLQGLTMRPRKKMISINSRFILVLLFNWSLSHPKQWHYIPQAITPGQTSSPVSPPPCPHISGWLLCVSSSICGRLRPWRDSFYIIFLLSQLSPKRWDIVSPHAPTLVGCCVFLLSFGHKANSFPVSLIFEGSLYSAQNRVTNRHQLQTWRRTPRLGNLIASAPWFGGATGLPMEGEGKAAGG